MKSAILLILFLQCALIIALPIAHNKPKTNMDLQTVHKREDSVDRAQDAQIGGALRGFVLPDIFGMVPTSPLGGQPPDDD